MANIRSTVDRLYGNSVYLPVRQKVEKAYGQSFNPFISKNTGQVVNPYADYQPVMDNEETQERVKNWIHDATGLTPRKSTLDDSNETDSGSDDYFDANIDKSKLSSMDIATQLPKLNTQQIAKIVQTHFSNSPVISANDAQGIYNAQKSTGMSALAILSIGALESGWGTSNIAKKTNNIWGYGATNSNPEGNAHRYNQMSDGAAQYATEFMKTYYNGYGLKSIGAVGSGGGNGNIAYAQDGHGNASTTWAPQVSNIMGKLYDTAKTVSGGTAGSKATRFGTSGSSSRGQQLVDEAMKYLGTPYVWGGTSPKGFDCSGLMQYVANKVGINISRVSEDQVHNGTAVDKANLQPGDLVFFATKSGSASSPGHVGMYVGNGRYIQAPHTGDVVKISNLADRSDYVGARRIV